MHEARRDHTGLDARHGHVEVTQDHHAIPAAQLFGASDGDDGAELRVPERVRFPGFEVRGEDAEARPRSPP